MRLYFATDVHGSEKCWRKFLNAGKHYSADVIVLGGDMTGKALVPVISDGGGRWQLRLWWKPFVTLIWLGGAMVAFGGFLALVGRVRRGRRAGRQEAFA